jgi:hypothetical protein
LEDFRRDVTDKLTLGEMRERDIDNLTLVTTKQCKEYSFNSLKEALKWTNDAIQGIFIKFGIDKDGIIRQAMSYPLDHFQIQQVKKECAHLPKQYDPRKLLAMKLLDKRMKDVDIQQEDRQYDNKEDVWRTGHYFYHHNEIAYFISAPYRRKGGHYQTPHIIVPAFGKWFIQSNWRILN